MSRRDALAYLIRTRFDGNQAALAHAVSRQPSVIWQYLTERRQMGEKMARHIERKLRLPVGWLDDYCVDAPMPLAHAASLSDEDQLLLDTLATLSPEDRALVESTINRLSRQKKTKK